MANDEQETGSRSIDRLIPEVYRDLRRIAAHFLRQERPNHTLQPTDLVNEVYLQMKEQHSLSPEDRRYVIGIASMMMRRFLVDYAKRRLRAKRGSGATISLDDEATVLVSGISQDPTDVLELERSLQELARHDASFVRVVELRFYGGLSLEEIALIMNISLSTVNRKWRFARAWLRERLT